MTFYNCMQCSKFFAIAQLAFIHKKKFMSEIEMASIHTTNGPTNLEQRLKKPLFLYGSQH